MQRTFIHVTTINNREALLESCQVPYRLWPSIETPLVLYLIPSTRGGLAVVTLDEYGEPKHMLCERKWEPFDPLGPVDEYKQVADMARQLARRLEELV